MEPPPVSVLAANPVIDRFSSIYAEGEMSSSDDEKFVEPIQDLESAKAQHEMFLAGAASGGVARNSAISQLIVSKYPMGSSIVKLDSTLEIKKWWLYNEWDPVCQFSKGVQQGVPDRGNLDPQKDNAALVPLIEKTFDFVRGRYRLWGEMKESAQWKKVVVEKLELKWVLENVEILFPVPDQFALSALNGVVLWKKSLDKKSPKDPLQKRFEAIEGNHRLSSWISLKEPASLPAIIFIGKPKKNARSEKSAE